MKRILFLSLALVFANVACASWFDSMFASFNGRYDGSDPEIGSYIDLRKDGTAVAAFEYDMQTIAANPLKYDRIPYRMWPVNEERYTWVKFQDGVLLIPRVDFQRKPLTEQRVKEHIALCKEDPERAARAGYYLKADGKDLIRKNARYSRK